MSALVDIDRADLDEEGDEPAGFLGFHVPLLRQVPVGVQLDLLGETWARHRSAEPVPATLLDGALLYAACETAAGLGEDAPSL
jgi:predicted small secreted protein